MKRIQQNFFTMIASSILIITLQEKALSLEVHIQGDRITIKAENNSLEEVLREIAYSDVDVRLDPGVEAIVDGDLLDVDMEEALDKLLGNFGYAIKWKIVEGPMGDWPRLSEIIVYRNGYKSSAKPLMAEDTALFKVIVDQDGTRYIADEVLIGLKPGTTREEFKAILSIVRGRVIESTPELGIYRIKLPRNSSVSGCVAKLNQHEKVAVSEPNYSAALPKPQPEPTNVTQKKESSAAEKKKSKASRKKTDISCGVAVLDTGFDKSIDQEGVINKAFDATNPGASIRDDHGHGTQMTQLAGGSVQPSGVQAQSDTVPVIPIRTFDKNGNTSNYALIDAINYAIDEGISVISMSWGTGTDSKFLHRAIQYANQNGVTMVAAAGNEPTGNKVYPAAYPETIGVGALDADGKLWKKSNYGSFVDLTAPGAANFPMGKNGPLGSYKGTSIATAVTANRIARYKCNHPDSDTTQIREALNASLTDAGESGRDDYYGAGIFDAAAEENFF